jgi:hypothetical protein
MRATDLTLGLRWVATTRQTESGGLHPPYKWLICAGARAFAQGLLIKYAGRAEI